MPDIEGAELSGLDAAREEAVRLSGALLNENAHDFWRGEAWSMEVHDEADTVLFTLTFTATEGPLRVPSNGRPAER